MLSDIITHATQRLQHVFDHQETDLAARAAGWVKRTSKLDGLLFLQILVVGFVKYPHASLNQLAQVGWDMGLEITSQGLDERLTPAAVTFLQERLGGLLQRLQVQRQRVMAVLEGFTEVYFHDSTSISLPESLQTEFPGSGGSASPAALKVQLLFGFLSGQMRHLSVETGRCADQSYRDHVAYLQAGSLLIQDLGFFNFALLQGVVERGAFFLTRWRTDVQVFLEDNPNQRVDMPALLQQQTEAVASYQVLMGREARLAVRMVCVRLPQEVAETRRRRAKADARRRGRTVSARSLFWCDWNIFVTNLPEHQLSLKQVLVCYGLRWQVELLFKVWKSQAALHQSRGLRRERVLCEFYAKLIGLVLTQFLMAPLCFLLWEQQVQISLSKARPILADRLLCVMQALHQEPAAVNHALSDLVDRILRFCRKNKRKTCLSTLDRLLLANQLEVAQLFCLA